MKHSFYRWADLNIEVRCTEGTLIERLDHCWRTFFCVTPLTSPPPATMLALQLQSTPSTPPLGQPLWQRDDARVWQTADGLCLQLGATTLLIDTARGHASGSIAEAFWHYPLAEQRDFFMRTLLLLLRGAQVYGLHANGVSDGKRALLLVGPSGSGKTTLTLSLQQAGWQALGDDVMALRATAHSITALALQRGFACTPQTVNFFPHLPTAQAIQLETVRYKQWVALRTAEAVPCSSACQPTVLLFPQIIDAAHSRLLPLNETQALLGLMGQSAALLVERRAAAQQMTLLHQLVRQTRSYRLALGRDVYADPPAVAALLAALE